MIGFLVRRTLVSLALLWAVSTVTYVALFAVGDPVANIVGPRASARDREHVRRFYGLDQPVAVQYARFLGRLASGDLGLSYRYRRPVQDLIVERFPRTLLLATMALVLEVVAGVLLGVVAAARRGRWSDSAIMGGSFVLTSMPTFLTGQLLLLGAAYHLGWFPVGGYGTTAFEHIRHAVLPAITLALVSIAYYARLTRSEMLEVLEHDYIRTARAKGVREATIVVRHALRNALLPIVTSVGLSFGTLFTGAIVTETIFAWPGLGRLAFEAINTLDRPVIVGCVLFGAFGIVLGNLLADLAYGWLDPRIHRQ